MLCFISSCQNYHILQSESQNLIADRWVVVSFQILIGNIYAQNADIIKTVECSLLIPVVFRSQ